METDSPRSPEAEIGHRVEDLWEVAQPQLSPSEKLNSCFEDIPVAAFPRNHPSQGNHICNPLARLIALLFLLLPPSSVSCSAATTVAFLCEFVRM